ncbi:MAG: hypothetical protein H3C54_14510 [Taibaiella sp.]|nr:hypothetical protein [Taibaiella sp.]
MKTIILACCLLVTTNCVLAQQKNNKTEKKAEQQAVQHLKLYPTQASTYVNVYVDYELPTDFTIKIVGSPLNDERKWDIKAKSSYQQTLDVSQLPNGTYTITLDGGGIHEKAEFAVKR